MLHTFNKTKIVGKEQQKFEELLWLLANIFVDSRFVKNTVKPVNSNPAKSGHPVK
jgi:hypothetical protein